MPRSHNDYRTVKWSVTVSIVYSGRGLFEDELFTMTMSGIEMYLPIKQHCEAGSMYRRCFALVHDYCFAH